MGRMRCELTTQGLSNTDPTCVRTPVLESVEYVRSGRAAIVEAITDTPRKNAVEPRADSSVTATPAVPRDIASHPDGLAIDICGP